MPPLPGASMFALYYHWNRKHAVEIACAWSWIHRYVVRRANQSLVHVGHGFPWPRFADPTYLGFDHRNGFGGCRGRTRGRLLAFGSDGLPTYKDIMS